MKASYKQGPVRHAFAYIINNKCLSILHLLNLFFSGNLHYQRNQSITTNGIEGAVFGFKYVHL